MSDQLLDDILHEAKQLSENDLRCVVTYMRR